MLLITIIVIVIRKIHQNTKNDKQERAQSCMHALCRGVWAHANNLLLWYIPVFILDTNTHICQFNDRYVYTSVFGSHCHSCEFREKGTVSSSHVNQQDTRNSTPTSLCDRADDYRIVHLMTCCLRRNTYLLASNDVTPLHSSLFTPRSWIIWCPTYL